MATAQEWFRRTSWGPADREDFHTRLRRVRPDNRAQYLRIQAGHLAEAGLHAPALELLDAFFEAYADSDEAATALGQQAASLLALGRLEEVLDAYAASVARMQANPRMKTDAWLDYVLLVAERGARDHYERAAEALATLGAQWPLWLPHDAFRRHAALALLLSDRGQPGADAEAKAALEAADRAHSGLGRHPSIGLVGPRYADLRKRLARIAAGR
ncbi:hypothetical protein ACFODL_01820 [Phenylobacterium terrae]|uniref:Tetratricopeptide repeat protein n=1 Tax=Phenylobacterium terrae TaxID=2665495 RepID=A0ABW4MWH7_9CAUL